MTVLPTVRRQIEQAAHRQAGARSGSGLEPLPTPAAVTARPARRRARPSAGGVAVALGAVLALGIATAAIVLLPHRRTVTNSPATGRAQRYPLDGDGIGTIRFEARPDTVVAGLARLLGRPEGARTGERVQGLRRSICGFDHEVDWVSLAQRPTAPPYTHSAGLTVYFRHSRFAGYTYAPWGDRNTPLVRHGVMLSTGQGLGLSEPLARGPRLYGPAFVISSQRQGTPPNPRLERLPAWHVRTATGLLYGYIDSPKGPNSAYRRTIGSISAGSIPNTPCRAQPTRTNRK